MEWIIAILGITIAPLSSYISWILARRKRNNDFLADLQASIDLLTENYKKALNELTLLRAENIDLKSTQQEMLAQIKELKIENSELKEIINDLNIKLKEFTRS